MKKGLVVLVVLFVLLSFIFLEARVVELEDILDNSEVLSNYLIQEYELTQSVSIDPNNVFPLVQDGYIVAWIVNLEPEGWAMLSAITEEYPVLMFAEEGHFQMESIEESCVPNENDEENLCDPIMRKHFEYEKKELLFFQYSAGYISDISEIEWLNDFVIGGNVADLKPIIRNLKDWSNINIFSPEYQILNPQFVSTETDKRKVLIEANNKWFQFHGYNNLFPPCHQLSLEQVVVGCVALAHSQMMRFWRYPEKYIRSDQFKMTYYNGYHYTAPYDKSEEQSYNWDDMPHQPLRTAVPKQIQKLLYDASVSFITDWGCDDSGAYLFNARDAMVENFGFSEESKYIYYQDSFKKEVGLNYMDIVEQQVDAGLPVTLGINEGSGHSVTCFGYKKNTKDGITKWEARLNMGWYWSWQHNVWKTIKSTYIDDLNVDLYPKDFCGFEDHNFHAIGEGDTNCKETKQDEQILFENDGVGLAIDTCPKTYNPGQFAKYWCLDENPKDGFCDVKKEGGIIKLVDIIRDDCSEDSVCIRVGDSSTCAAPYNKNDEFDSTVYRPCSGKSLRECISNNFTKSKTKTDKNGNDRNYILYKIYDQIYDVVKMAEYVSHYTTFSHRYFYNPGSPKYAWSDFFYSKPSNESGWELNDYLCFNRQYELDSPEFFENCIELKNGNVPKCENQCEFTYSKTVADVSSECPPCLKENQKVFNSLNPVRENGVRDVSESDWNLTTDFEMCKDSDGDELCDNNIVLTCGTDEFQWNDICVNPERYRVRPADNGHDFLKDNCPKVYNPQKYNAQKGEWEQSDWNEDLRGDACDFDGDGIEDDIDPRVYFAEGGSEKLNFEDPEDGYTNKNDCPGNAMVGHCFGTGWYGRTLNISGFVGIKDPQKNTSKIEAKFCYCGDIKEAHVICKESGFCGRNHVRTGSFWDSTGTKETWQSANKPVFVNRESYDIVPSVMIDRSSEKINYNKEKSSAPQIYTGMKKANFSWDWEYVKHPVLSGVTEISAATKEEKDALINSGDYPAIRLSFAPVNKVSESYSVADGVNIKRYENYYQEATQAQLGSKIEYAFSDFGMIDLIIENKFNSLSAWWLPSLPPYWWHLLDAYLRPGLGDFRPMPGDPWEWSSSVSLADARIRPGEFTSVSFTENTMVLNSLKNENPYQQSFKFGNADFIYAFENQNFMLKMANEAGFFETQTVVRNGIDMKSAAVLVDGNKIFMAGNMITSPNQQSANELNTTFENKFVSIDVTASGAVMNVLASFPSTNNVQFLKIIELGNRIFIISESSTGLMELFKYNSEANSWQSSGSQQLNTPVALNNGMVKDEHFYLPVKQDQNNTEILAFDGTDFFSFATIEKPYDAYLKLFPKDENIIAVVTNLLTENNVPAYEISTDGINEISIPVIKGSIIMFNQEFCIYENNSSIFPGTTNESGECISVYDYDYETVSYFDYKYTVAGYKNNLYLGGLTGVRRVEIGADGSLTDKDMLYSGETNNLAVYGNAMYGANYGEVDIYSIAEAGSISRVSGIGASSCKNVRTSDGKLFTAENKKVRIFNLTNPLSPQLVKTITTAGTVIDLEVVGNKLYIYEETTSWLTTKGFTGIYDITNLNSPVRTKYFEKRCTDAEMQKSGNSIYLGCKNGQFRVTNTGLSGLTGKKDYVREGYSYNETLYQVFSGYLHLSKTATIQAVCGNGVMEPGEVCDSDILQCSELDTEYIGGIAACNSTCDGYNETNCEVDGW